MIQQQLEKADAETRKDTNCTGEENVKTSSKLPDWSDVSSAISEKAGKRETANYGVYMTYSSSLW